MIDCVLDVKSTFQTFFFSLLLCLFICRYTIKTWIEYFVYPLPWEKKIAVIWNRLVAVFIQIACQSSSVMHLIHLSLSAYSRFSNKSCDLSWSLGEHSIYTLDFKIWQFNRRKIALNSRWHTDTTINCSQVIVNITQQNHGFIVLKASKNRKNPPWRAIKKSCRSHRNLSVSCITSKLIHWEKSMETFKVYIMKLIRRESQPNWIKQKRIKKVQPLLFGERKRERERWKRRRY